MNFNEFIRVNFFFLQVIHRALLTCVQAPVVGLHDPLDAPALRLPGVAVQGEAVVGAPVDQAAEAQGDELAV